MMTFLYHPGHGLDLVPAHHGENGALVAAVCIVAIIFLALAAYGRGGAK